MPIINLKKFYYTYYTKDTFIEVSNEVLQALLTLSRQENDQAHKIWYHKATANPSNGQYCCNGQAGAFAMPRMSKKRKLEWAFFLNHRNHITYNILCRKCVYGCKQSFRTLPVLPIQA